MNQKIVTPNKIGISKDIPNRKKHQEISELDSRKIIFNNHPGNACLHDI